MLRQLERQNIFIQKSHTMLGVKDDHHLHLQRQGTHFKNEHSSLSNHRFFVVSSEVLGMDIEI